MFTTEELDVLTEEAVREAIAKVVSEELGGRVDLSRATPRGLDTAVHCLRYYKALIGGGGT